MRVFLEIKEENGNIHFINLDQIEFITRYENGKIELVTNDGNLSEISEDEFKRWKKFVEVI